MLVIGGYNSSNTTNLARICADRLPTYHIADVPALVSAGEIRHRPVRAGPRRWRPAGSPPDGPLAVGMTAGASTPDTSSAGSSSGCRSWPTGKRPLPPVVSVLMR